MPMVADIKKRRRQVAWICFEPYLSEAQLISAIQILEQNYQNDGISNMVAYVSRICSEFGVKNHDKMHLYGRFRDMMKEKTDLLFDPLVRIHEKNLDKSTPKPSGLMPVMLEAELRSSSLAEDPVGSIAPPAHTVMFTHFMKQIFVGSPEITALFEMLKEFSEDKKLGAKDTAEVISRWSDNPDNFTWARALDEKMLTQLIHLVYLGLCEILGPIDADRLFHKAIESCKQQPEARQFPPARFL